MTAVIESDYVTCLC